MPKSFPNLLAVLVLAVAVYQNWWWPWGALFLYWTILAYLTGEVNLISAITRRDTPVLYWFVLTAWLVLSLYYIAYDIWLHFLL
jgi:hypothetical protein